jgi:hypothetical protein
MASCYEMALMNRPWLSALHCRVNAERVGGLSYVGERVVRTPMERRQSSRFSQTRRQIHFGSFKSLAEYEWKGCGDICGVSGRARGPLTIICVTHPSGVALKHACAAGRARPAQRYEDDPFQVQGSPSACATRLPCVSGSSALPTPKVTLLSPHCLASRSESLGLGAEPTDTE